MHVLVIRQARELFSSARQCHRASFKNVEKPCPSISITESANDDDSNQLKPNKILP